jgi:hypothetical protein
VTEHTAEPTKPIEAVRTYLEESFPGKSVKLFTDGLSGDECFRIEGDGISLRVQDEFLAAPASRVHEELRQLGIASAMRDAGRANRVILTRSGDEKAGDATRPTDPLQVSRRVHRHSSAVLSGSRLA